MAAPTRTWRSGLDPQDDATSALLLHAARRRRQQQSDRGGGEGGGTGDLRGARLCKCTVYPTERLLRTECRLSSGASPRSAATRAAAATAATRRGCVTSTRVLAPPSRATAASTIIWGTCEDDATAPPLGNCPGRRALRWKAGTRNQSTKLVVLWDTAVTKSRVSRACLAWVSHLCGLAGACAPLYHYHLHLVQRA